ncbi:MAG: PEP-CTERM sorting domain-containing protein [Syntrophales bacterium]
MKKELNFSMIVLLGVLLVLAGSIVQAQAAPYSLIMDEYGPGYERDLGNPTDPWHVWNGQLRGDPTWQNHTSLSYIGLRSNSFTGYFDVLAKDPNGANSDMLRYWNPPSTTLYTWVIFYSADTGGGAPADTGLPPTTSWNVQYTVYEDSNGIFEWISPVSGNDFKAYSEGHASTPEPTTMLLLVLGLIGLAGVRRKFQK